jgi:hypothetical protein
VIPLEPGREAARALARRELARPDYHRDDPSLLERILRAVLDLARRTIAAVDPRSGELGWLALLVLVVALAAALALVRARVGPVARTPRTSQLFEGPARTAAQHRQMADAHAAAGRWDEAVRERWRALVRGLEDRGVLDPRPGRTVDEAAREVPPVVPGSGPALAAAARVFDDIWYAGVPAAATHDAIVRQAEEQVR